MIVRAINFAKISCPYSSSFVPRLSSFVIRLSSFVIRHSFLVIRLSSFVIRHSSLKKRPFPHAWAMHPFLRRTFAPEF